MLLEISPIYWVGVAVLGMGLGALIGAWIFRRETQRRKATMEREAREVLEHARREAESLSREARLQATEESLKVRAQAELMFVARRTELAETEHRLTERERLINRQLEQLIQNEKTLRLQQEDTETRAATLQTREAELDRLIQERRQLLQNSGHLTAMDAREQLLKEFQKEAQTDASAYARHIMEDARMQAEQKARRLVGIAIQRFASEHTWEITTCTVQLPNDDIKGRIIGREGRNIRSFESATGVTVLIDDVPNAVVLSSFDPLRRDIAREAMEKLIQDGRIHPGRIEEIVAQVQQDMEQTMLRAGEEALGRVGLPPMADEIVRVLGRLKYRLSFSQNVLEHSIEVAQLMGLMASELGQDVTLAKRIGMLHDVGKALSQDIEGAHAIVGAEFLKRHGEPEEVTLAVASHHDDIPQDGLWHSLVTGADAISASRPGARSEAMTTYLKRVESLERIGASFPGVERVYAIQAGRELRVMVQPDQLNDEQAYELARNISHRISGEIQHPGQIRVVVIRETRCVEFAK